VAIRVTSSDDVRAEINVTPLVDVVLVLLVIFMVVTPLLKEEIALELPAAESASAVEDVTEVTLRLPLDGRVLLNGADVPPDELPARLAAAYAGRAVKTILLEADRALPHGQVVDVMDICRAAGIDRIGFVTQRGTGPSALNRVPSETGAPGG
jgi:biopolymer transport protein TolR